MFITRTSLPRRTFLRGVGATVALPFLDAMVSAATAQTARPVRAGFIYIPHGAAMASWTPTTAGNGFDLSPSLQPLAPFKKSLTVVSNLRRAGGQAAMHAAAACGWLSGVEPKQTEAEDFYSGTTIDQVLARQIGQGSPLPSLEYATEDFTGYVGGCTPNYACAYLNSISWASPTTPLPNETNPRFAFEKLFGDGGSDPQRRRQLLREDRSILDAVVGEMRTLQSRLGAHDRAKVGDYLDDVREIERRIARAETQQLSDVAVIDKPLGVPGSFEEHSALMFDLLAIAWQADLSRVFSFMLSRELSQRTFPELGVNDPWHVVSHHGDRPEKLANNAKVNVFCLQMFAKFLEKLENTQDGDGSLLSHALVFYGSGMANSNVHATDPLPMVVVGGKAGRGDRHLQLAPKTQLGNLWLSVANQFGGSFETFGESTGGVSFF